MFTQIADKVAFVNYLPLLTQATADDGDHTPGYLLGEIKNITYKSLSSSHQLAEYFVHRLNKSSTKVKVKILKIIIYLIENGHVSFRQGLRQNDGPIKNALLHSGVPDPLLGRSQFQEVQKLAQEALDLLFNPTMMQQEEVCSEVLSPLYPLKAFMGGMGAGSKITGKYEGFGNSPRDREGTVADRMLDYLGRFMHSSEEETDEAIRAALHSSPGNYQPVPVTGTCLEPVIPLNVPTPKVSFKKNHIPGKAGGGWESDDDTDLSGSKEVEDSSFPIASITGFKQVSPNPLECDADRDCEKTIECFCRGNGPPTVDELEEVCMRCTPFNQGDVVYVLHRIFSAPQHTEHFLLRALLLTEWLQHCHPASGQAFLQLCPQFLEPFTDPKREISQAVKTKARKLNLILQKIGLDESC